MDGKDGSAINGVDSEGSEEEGVMIYNVSERPPIYLSIFFGLQVSPTREVYSVLQYSSLCNDYCKL